MATPYNESSNVSEMCLLITVCPHTILSPVCLLEPCLLTNTVQGSAAIFPNCMLLSIGMQVVFWLLAVAVVAVG
jgi:hypothetical protein